MGEKIVRLRVLSILTVTVGVAVDSEPGCHYRVLAAFLRFELSSLSFLPLL